MEQHIVALLSRHEHRQNNINLSILPGSILNFVEAFAFRLFLTTSLCSFPFIL